MSLKEILEKTTIKFPRPIGREEAEKLLCYIANNLPANVSATTEYDMFYYHSLDEDLIEKTNGTLKVNAEVDSVKERGLFDSFESETWKEDMSYISSIAFQRARGSELSDYDPEKIKLWGGVREVVEKYFKEVLKTTDKKRKH